MAIDPERDGNKNRGLQGVVNRTKGAMNGSLLGRKDSDGNSYLKLFITETLLQSIAISDKSMNKDQKKALLSGSYSDQVKKKEFTPVGMALGLALFSLPIATGTGFVAGVVAPSTEYEQSQVAAPLGQHIDGAYTISLNDAQNYVLIVDDGRYELYLDNLDGKLYLQSQADARRTLDALAAEIENENLENNIEIDFNYSYRGISQPLLDENEDGESTGAVMRTYEERVRNYESYDLVGETNPLTQLWLNATEAAETAQYSLSAEELAEVETDYEFWDGFDDGFNYGFVGLYLFSVFSGAAGVAGGRVRQNPSNGSRRNKDKTLKP